MECDEALAMIADWTAKGEAKSVGVLGNAADLFPELVARMKAGGACAMSCRTTLPQASCATPMLAMN